MRAVIYARYSSVLQDDRSIEDQIRLCRENIERDKGTVVDIYTDYPLDPLNLQVYSRTPNERTDCPSRSRKEKTGIAEAETVKLSGTMLSLSQSRIAPCIHRVGKYRRLGWNAYDSGEESVVTV